jgi:CBS domain-containing protein
MISTTSTYGVWKTDSPAARRQYFVASQTSGDSMNVKVAELMSDAVLTAQPHQSVEHIRQLLSRNNISSVPVVDSDDQPVGVVSATDLAKDLKAGSPISSIMTGKVYVVPKYEDVSIAARVMRNHKIHHVVVTHEKKVVGVLSAFDLLKLVEEHRYIAKNPPTKSARKGSKRR